MDSPRRGGQASGSGSGPTSTAPRWESSALLIIDVQRDVLSESPVGIPGTSEVLPQFVRLVEAFRAAGRPRAHLVRLYQANGTDADLVRRDALRAGMRMLLVGTPGSQIAPGLLPPGSPALDTDLLLSGAPQVLGPDEVILFKPRWSAFFRTGLAQWLAERWVSTVAVTGCNFPNCPRATAVDAISHDLRVVVVDDAVSGFTTERMSDLAGLGPRSMTTSDVVTALGASTD